eukprot:GILK01008929.1.p1 GENE.GILK01008929.1~~GILK01008929.1.p1  ORF type:complete len:541 (+),score=76.96 GILK01008929.1:87-1709(+)
MNPLVRSAISVLRRPLQPGNLLQPTNWSWRARIRNIQTISSRLRLRRHHVRLIPWLAGFGFGAGLGSVVLLDSFEEAHVKPMEAPSAALAELKALLGDRLSVDEDERLMHGKDHHSYHAQTVPSAVVYPKSTEEVSAIVKVCNAYKLPIVPYGSGTSLEGHTTAPKGGITIDFTNMDQIKELHVKDMDVVVQPGMQWMNLNAKLAEHGLFFPMDPGPGASVGGMIGTNCSGTNAVHYGMMKQYVLNLTVVLPDGTVMKTANRARKSSAGYDLTRLFVGSEGTLGVVTEATLKLVPIPEQTAVAVCQFPSLHAAADSVTRITEKGIQLGAVELMDDVMIRAVNQFYGLKYQELPTLFFKFVGTEAQVQDAIKHVSIISDSHQGSQFQWAIEQKQRERIWEARKGALWASMILKPNSSVWTTDVCVPISRLADAIDQTKSDIERAGIIAPIVGHVGDGNFHVFILIDPTNPDDLARAKQVNSRMVERAISMEGTCTGEHGVGIGKKAYLPKELGPEAINFMRLLKRSIDPNNIMNPGKIFDL